MNLLSLAAGITVARSAGIVDAGEQIRLGLLGAVAGGVVGVALTNQMARNEVGSAAPKPVPVPPVVGGGPLGPPPADTRLVEVPAVVDLTADEAARLLTDLGLLVSERYARPGSGQPKGTVLEQDEYGIVPLGSVVVLTISTGVLDEPGEGQQDIAARLEEIEDGLEKSAEQQKAFAAQQTLMMELLNKLLAASGPADPGGPGSPPKIK